MHLSSFFSLFFFFFFNDTATTEIYTLSLHDALPICTPASRKDTAWGRADGRADALGVHLRDRGADRKSTRLNSSHEWISYGVVCLQKKKQGKPDCMIQHIFTLSIVVYHRFLG